MAIGVRGEAAILITNDDRSTAWATERFGDPNVRSRRGGHWYFKPSTEEGNEPNRETAVGTMEFHRNNKYALVPPSVHPSGTAYAWARPLPPVAELPEAPDLRDLWHPRGEHHEELLRLSAAKAHSGLDADTIGRELKVWRDTHLSDLHAHPDDELERMAKGSFDKFHGQAPGRTRSTEVRTGNGESPPELAAPVGDGAVLFAKLVERIRAHYYFEEEWHYTITALYIFQCWAARAGALPAFFYLYYGGQFGSGKSNILYLLSSLTDSLLVENISTSALARSIEAGRPVCQDEIDVSRGTELDDIMAALWRSGYRRNGPPYIRWDAKNKQREVVPIYSPKAATFRSVLDPALQSRGFTVPTAKPLGKDGYRLVLANLWSRTSDLVAQLRAWGRAGAKEWPDARLEALARTPEFQSEVESVVGEIGANRTSELFTIALLVAHMVPVEVATSLSSAGALREVAVGEDQAEALEELREAVVATIESTVSSSLDGQAVYRVVQRAVRDAVNGKHKERGDRPLTTARLALLRRELGVKDSWLVNFHG